MALREKKAEAIRMRKEGATYTQIKDRVRVSKSTLSLWLRDMPLSKERMDEVRGKNPRRIERYRETMRKKREQRLASVRKRLERDIGVLSKRDMLIGGMFLYWGEGGKTEYTTTVLTNTDPGMINFFIAWLQLLGVEKENIRIYVHLYIDMNIAREISYWSKVTGIPKKQFRKPYIKTSRQSEISYPQRFSHGTCNVIYSNRDIAQYVHEACKYLHSLFIAEESQI